jgi:citrate lyase subunit beta/citryl-CoA lyase
VPGSNERFLEKAPGLGADQVFLDLEDAVAPAAKEAARVRVAQAVRGYDWGETVVSVRVNAWDTRWTYGDVIEVVGTAGPRLDSLILPKVHRPADVVALDLLLAQVEAVAGLTPGQVGIEPQIESAAGLLHVGDIAAASPRVEAVVLGPVDLSASLGLRPELGDPWPPVLMSILVAGRTAGVQVLDGPSPKLRDLDGLRAEARRAAAFGYDGKWSIHPDQIAVINEVFSPSQEDFDRAWALLDAYAAATEQDHRGAVVHGGEMIDEASRKAALAVVARGEGAGLRRPDGP